MVSESVTQTGISTKLTATTVPGVVGESFVFDELGMTAATSAGQGSVVSQSSVDVTAAGAAHPLGADLAGGNAVTSTTATVTHGWGAPAAAAMVAATVAGDAAKATVFGYDTGALMVTGTAPARRVGFFYYGGTGTVLNSTSAELFDASVQWASKTAPVLSYQRDVSDRITARTVNGAVTAKYAYTASADSPDVTLNAAGVVVERTISLPGGVLVTKRASAATDVWSYPNIHGDVVATTNGAGLKAGATRAYDPFGNPLGTSSIPDNSAGALDYGWHGEQQRPLEHNTGLTPLIEMGARQYSPLLGRFLEVDPILGGSCNDYDYVCANPVNRSDLDGQICWSCHARNAKRAVSRAGKKARQIATRLTPRGALGSVARFYAAHRGLIATIGATAGCLVPAVGLAVCAGLQAAAWAVRSQQRGYRRVKENSLDAGVTAMSLGLVGLPARYAGAGRTGWAAFRLNLRFSAVSDGPQIAACLAAGQRRTGC